MSETTRTDIAIGSTPTPNAALPMMDNRSDQDRIAAFREQLFRGKLPKREVARAVKKSGRTLDRLIVALNIPVYQVGNEGWLDPVEMRQAIEAEARRRIEERQRAMAPRAVGRPPAASKVAAARTAGRATKPAHAPRERQETARM